MNHTELKEASDRLAREYDILGQMVDKPWTSVEHLSLCLHQAKRVRNASTLLVRALARTRDQLQP